LATNRQVKRAVELSDSGRCKYFHVNSGTASLLSRSGIRQHHYPLNNTDLDAIEVTANVFSEEICKIGLGQQDVAPEFTRTNWQDCQICTALAARRVRYRMYRMTYLQRAERTNVFREMKESRHQHNEKYYGK
jgi:hypothetical protein